MLKPKVLLFYNYLSSFVKKDVEILNEAFAVGSHDFYAKKKSDTPFRFLSQFFFLLGHIWSAKLVVVEFAGYHSLLPVLFAKLLGKKSLIISGGTDAHYFPGIGYGNWQKKYLRTFTRLSFKWCSHIAPKHKTLMQSLYEYDKSEPAEQGIYARIPGLKTPYTEIPNGYDPVKWRCTKAKKKNTFITVSGAWEYPFQQQLKGIDLILQVAPSFPDCEFIILGVDDVNRIVTDSPNVKVLPAVPNEKLIDIFSECEFYMQLSMAEGFPNSICEAMLCECVPIGSAVFSIPEIINGSGFVLHKRDALALKDVITSALAGDRAALGKQARERIAANYTHQMRKEKLLGACEG